MGAPLQNGHPQSQSCKRPGRLQAQKPAAYHDSPFRPFGPSTGPFDRLRTSLRTSPPLDGQGILDSAVGEDATFVLALDGWNEGAAASSQEQTVVGNLAAITPTTLSASGQGDALRPGIELHHLNPQVHGDAPFLVPGRGIERQLMQFDLPCQELLEAWPGIVVIGFLGVDLDLSPCL